jgi:hypothetical protein
MHALVMDQHPYVARGISSPVRVRTSCAGFLRVPSDCGADGTGMRCTHAPADLHTCMHMGHT